LVNVEQINSEDIQQEFKLTHEQLYAELVSLASLNYIKVENKKVIRVVLTQ
jgi:hypothetical protein